jgi:hypothetical protein
MEWQPIHSAIDIRHFPHLVTHSRIRMLRSMDSDLRKQLIPGAKVKVTQQIAARHYSLPSVVTGTVVDFAQKETGSWFAHSRDDRLWLDRLVLKKADGEITTLNLDKYSLIEVEAPAGADGASPEKKNESNLPV